MEFSAKQLEEEHENGAEKGVQSTSEKGSPNPFSQRQGKRRFVMDPCCDVGRALFFTPKLQRVRGGEWEKDLKQAQRK